jgi:putative isomerase
MSDISPERAWNSWDSEFPAEMVYLPLGLRVGIAAYASSRNAFTRFPAGAPGLRLGPRTVDGESIGLEMVHAGTELSLGWQKPDARTVVGSWRAGRMAEWGLRFWVMVVLRLPQPGRPDLAEWRFDPETGEMTAEVKGAAVAVRGLRPPLQATFHDTLDDLKQEFETKGYFCLDSRGERGRVAVLRYHLEEMPSFRFAASVADDLGQARRKAEEALALAPKPPTAIQTGPHAGSAEAIRDVIAWNTVWDAVNRRPYTSLSRNWVSQKFGGFGVWLNDVLYHGLMAGLFDTSVARENLAAVVAGATPEGNLPCLLTGRDAWVDRSQPPICGLILWLLYRLTGSRELLDLALKPLVANHDWWWRVRDGNGNGLLEYGTSPVGSGLYRGTKLAAKDESSMDNSPTHDEATLDTKAWTLDCEDVGLNSLIALDGEMLADLLREGGEDGEADRLRSRAEALKGRIRTQLWDSERGVFANRLWSGAFVRSLAPTSFYPLLAGAATPEQAARMVELLRDPRKFGGTWMLPSVTRDDPAFRDNVYWRGRVWPPLNFLVYHGLRRAGFADEAARLADNGYRLFMGEWREHRRCPENYNAITGVAGDQPDTDTFYAWGALLPYIAVSEVSDLTPWDGWQATNDGCDGRLGPLRMAGRMGEVEKSGGRLRLMLDGRAVMETDRRGRIRGLEFGLGVARAVLPPSARASEFVLPHVAAKQVRSATLDSRPVEVSAAKEGVSLRLPPASAPQRLEVLWGPPS